METTPKAQSRSVLEAFAVTLSALRNCEKNGNQEWKQRWSERLVDLERNHLPRGSGFDCGTTFDRDASKDDKLVFHTEFHHMDEHGSYNGWTQHKVVVKPHFVFGFTLTISGRNRNDIKDCIADTFQHALNESVAAW